MSIGQAMLEIWNKKEVKIGMVIGFSQKRGFLLPFYSRNDFHDVSYSATDLVRGTVTYYCKIRNYTEHNYILCIVCFVYSCLS